MTRARTREFVALCGAMMAMIGLAIDVVLPALGAIGHDLRVQDSSHTQSIVLVLILGVAIGQLFYGPWSDAVGRRPAIVLGLVVFGAGCSLAFLASSLSTMLAGRFLQGMGAAGPRIVTLALVRDQYAGRDMARVMSLIVAVLMVGPLVAPFLGQGLLLIAPWRVLFLVLLLIDAAVLAWLLRRQPETLPRSRRLPARWIALGTALQEVVRSRPARGYAIAAGMVFGELFAYVSTAPQIFQGIYGVGAWFPFCFSASGFAIAGASLFNAGLVRRVGMRKLCLGAALSKTALAGAFLALAVATAGRPPLEEILTLLLAFFFCSGLLFGNLNALAMEPLGDVAGIAASVVGSLTWLLAMMLATLVGRHVDDTVTPLAAGFVVLGAALLVATRLAEGDVGSLVRHS